MSSTLSVLFGILGLALHPGDGDAWKADHTYYYRRTLPTSLAFAADGKSLLSADATGKLMSLNLTSEGNSYTWSAKVPGSHPAVAYSPDGNTLYATCDDGVIVFDAKGKQVGRIEKKNSKPIAIGVFPIKPLTKNDSWTQIVFGSARGYFVETWVTGRKPGSGGGIETSTIAKGKQPADPLAVPLAVDPRGRSAIMIGPRDATGQITGRAGANVLWAYVCGDYEAGSPGNRIMPGHDNTVVSAAWSKEGSTAVTGDAEGRVIEWNPTRLTDGARIGSMKELRRHEFGGRVAALAISNNGQRIAAYVLGEQSCVYVWNVGEPTADLRPIHVEPKLSGKNSFAAIALSADGKQIAACAGDRDWLEAPEDLTGKVRVWKLVSSPRRQPAPKLAFVNPHGKGRGTDFIIPNNNVIYSSASRREGSIYLYEIDNGEILSATSMGDDVSIRNMARSTCRDWIVIGKAKRDSEDKLFSAAVRHANMHPPRKTIDECEQLLGLAAGGKQLAVVRAGKIEVWNTVTGKLIRQAAFEHTRIDVSAFSPDGKTLAIADRQTLVLWDWRNNKHERIETGRRLGAIAFSPDGRTLAEGPHAANDIQLRDLETKKVVQTLTVNRPLSVPDLTFTQGGRVLIACNKAVFKDQSKNKISSPRIFLWDTTDASLAHKITVPGLPQSMDVSPNELYLAARVSGSGGSKLMGWRLDGKEITRNRGNAAPAAEGR